MLVARAMDAGVPVESLRELVALKRELDKDAAAQAFAAAKAQFDIDCPPIVRRTDNTQFKTTTTHDGRQLYRRYADLEDIDSATKEPLAKNGLCYSWGDAVVDGDMLTIKCVLAHRGGHREQSAVTFPVSSQAGSSPQQKYATAITYAQRYSLIGVLGLTTCEDDTDGNEPVTVIADDQAAVVRRMLDELNDPDVEKAVLTLAQVDSVDKIPVIHIDRIVSKLRVTIEKAKAAEGGQS